MLAQLADKAAADEPGECLDEKIAGEMGVLVCKPVAHGLVANHGGDNVLVEDEARGAVGEPANVFECLANEAARFLDEAAMEGALERIDPGEDYAFRGLRVKRREPLLLNQIADEEARGLTATRRHAGLRARSRGRSSALGGGAEPVADERAVLGTNGPVASQVRRGEGANPGD